MSCCGGGGSQTGGSQLGGCPTGGCGGGGGSVQKMGGPSNACGVACFRKTKPLMYDVFGPYPDEAIMTALDRILYYAGATKIQRMLNLTSLAGGISSASQMGSSSCPPPGGNAAATGSACSVCSLVCGNLKSKSNPSAKSTAKSKCCCACRPKTSCLSVSSRSSCAAAKPTTCLRPPSEGSPSRQRTPRVDFANPVQICQCPKQKRCDGGGPTLAQRMKRSLSMCSLACRRLKSKVATGCTPRADGQKWLWTRMVSQNDGCKVYEVYKDSTVERAPNELDGQKGPVIIFLVLPNGYIMPFETMSTN